MDWVAISSVTATAVVGVAGIAAAFFAPTRTQRAIEDRQRQRQFQRARRLVSEELYMADVGLRTALDFVERGQEIPAREIAPDTEWTAAKAILADALEDDDWDAVAQAYGVLYLANRSFREGRKATTFTPEMSERLHYSLEMVRTAKKKLDEAAPL